MEPKVDVILPMDGAAGYGLGPVRRSADRPRSLLVPTARFEVRLAAHGFASAATYCLGDSSLRDPTCSLTLAHWYLPLNTQRSQVALGAMEAGQHRAVNGMTEASVGRDVG